MTYEEVKVVQAIVDKLNSKVDFPVREMSEALLIVFQKVIDDWYGH